MEFMTIYESKTFTLIEKKSKFIANIFHVETRDEAENIIKETRKKYSDARHNCYAYSILDKTTNITKSSDDGEPSGTAGVPILNVIVNKKLYNVLIIVTRYFGGILLGTGGLVRAYTNSAVEVINNSKIIHMQKGMQLRLSINYNDFSKIKYYFTVNKCNIVNIFYGQFIDITVDVTQKIAKDIENNSCEISSNIFNVVIIGEKYIEKIK